MVQTEATTTTTQTTTSNALEGGEGGGFDVGGFEEDNKKNASFFRSYKSLLSRWPARKKHIDFLLAALGGGFGCDAKTCLAPNVHVHGPPSVGKTMLLRDMFDLLEKKFGFAHAYVNCVDAHDKKLMFEAIVEQLRPHFKEERRRRMLSKERARAIKAKEKEFKRKEEEKENECDDESNNKSICDNKTLEDGMIEVKTSLALVSAAVAKTATSAANKKKRKRAIHVADFVHLLKENLDRNGPRITIVVDDAHRLAEQKDDRFLPTLLKIGELTKRNIHVVTISCESIQTFQSNVDLVKPQTIFFDAYTKEELIEVLLKEAPRDIAKKHYRAFLVPMVAAFYDTCRAPRELRTALEPLWKRYSEKLYEAMRNGTPENELPEPRRLYANLMSAKKMKKVTNEPAASSQQKQQQQAKIHAGLTVPLSKANLALQRGEWPVPEERYFTGEAVLEDATGDAANATTNTSSIAKALDFDIPKLTKFLLLSAYIASKNDESVDNRIFITDATGGGNHRKRGRLGHDRNADRAARRSLEDANAFKLERLLSVFQHIVRRSYEENGADLADLEEELLSADVFTQISSATSLGLLVLSSGDAMCGGKYRSCVSDELAREVEQKSRRRFEALHTLHLIDEKALVFLRVI
ncbi:unnamed protein product [Bathycoccus prasinos]